VNVKRMDKKPEYKGPSEEVVTLGQSVRDGRVGGLIGLGAGAVAGALLHNKEKTHWMRLGFETRVKKRMGEPIDGEEWKYGGVAESRKSLPGISEEVVETAERTVKENRGLKGVWHIMGRGGKMITAGLLTMWIGSWIGEMIGRSRGAKKAAAARQQFEEITAENQMLSAQLEAVQTQPQKSFTAALERQESTTPSLTRG
jgi:hypothetical protein